VNRSHTRQTAKPAVQDAAEGSARTDGTNGKPQGQTDVDPIQQAEALRHSLREALAKSSELIRALKRHRKRSRLVETTLASLRELQGVAPK